MLEVGVNAAEFCLPNQDEEEICLRDVKGRWIVLYFYPKDNTPGCTTEACDFTAALPNFEDLNAIVLGVSPDSPQKHRNFIEKKELKITQIKSAIGYRGKTVKTIEALGLGKIRKTVILPDNPAIRGMINKIPHLLKVEELS